MPAALLAQVGIAPPRFAHPRLSAALAPWSRLTAQAHATSAARPPAPDAPHHLDHLAPSRAVCPRWARLTTQLSLQ